MKPMNLPKEKPEVQPLVTPDEPRPLPEVEPVPEREQQPAIVPEIPAPPPEPLPMPDEM